MPISKRLLEYAGLSKDVVLVGANTRLEIWDADAWYDYQNEGSDLMLDGVLKYNLNI